MALWLFQTWGRLPKPDRQSRGQCDPATTDRQGLYGRYIQGTRKMKILLSLEFLTLSVLNLKWELYGRSIQGTRFIKNYFYVPQSVLGDILFLPRLLVGLFVCLRPTLSKFIIIQLLQIVTWYLAYICVKSSRTIWGAKGQGQCHPLRSKVKLKVKNMQL